MSGLGISVCLAAAGHAVAQERAADAAYFIAGPTPEATQAARPAVEGWLRDRGLSPVALAAPPERAEPPITPHHVRQLADVEASLLRARELAARLREGEALRELAAAEQTLAPLLWLPHAHAWLSELFLQQGLCAAQWGEWGLSRTALARALTLDPQRVLQAAEAPPAVVALAQRLARARDAAPPAQSEVQVAEERAWVWLDGKALGSAPAPFSVPPGSHLLVVQAPGHLPYAAVITLPSGPRPIIRVALSPTPAEQARRALVRDRLDPQRARMRTEKLSRTRREGVWLFLAAGTAPHAVEALRCEAGSCKAITTLSTRPAGLPAASRGLATTPIDDTERPHARSRPWWKRWPLWTAVSVVLAGGAAAYWGLAARAEPDPERVLIIEPGPAPQP